MSQTGDPENQITLENLGFTQYYPFKENKWSPSSGSSHACSSVRDQLRAFVCLMLVVGGLTTICLFVAAHSSISYIPEDNETVLSRYENVVLTKFASELQIIHDRFLEGWHAFSNDPNVREFSFVVPTPRWLIEFFFLKTDLQGLTPIIMEKPGEDGPSFIVFVQPDPKYVQSENIIKHFK